MKRQPYPVANLVGGLNKALDPVFIKDQEFPEIKNLVFEKGRLRKDYGWKAFGNNVTDPVMLLDSFPLQSGSTKLLALTTKAIYQYISANANFDRVNTIPGTFTGNQDDRWASVVLLDANGNDMYVFTNGKDPIQKWDGGGGNSSNLNGWANMTAKYVASFKNRLFCAYMTEGGTLMPKRVQYSVVANPEDKANTGSGFIDLVDTSDHIAGFATIKDQLLVLKERSIWDITYVGGNNYFTPTKLVDAVGTYSPHTIVPLGDSIIFFGSDDIYIYDGHNLESIGASIYPLLYETVDKIVNASSLHRAVAEYIEELGEYWLAVPTQKDDPDTVFKYNFQTKSWTMREEIVTAYGFHNAATGNSWLSGSGSWANGANGVPWMSSSLRPEAPTTLRGDANGNVWEDDRLQPNTGYGSFESKDWMFGHAMRVLELRGEIKGGPCNISCSFDGGLTWMANKQFAAANDWTEMTYELNQTTQRLRMRIDTQASNLEVKWIEPWYVPRKRSSSVTRPM